MDGLTTSRTGRQVRKWTTLVLTLAVMVLAVAACGSSSSGSSTATAASGSETISVVRPADLDTIDPHVATTFAALETLPLIYQSLVTFNPQLAVQPELAQSWSFSNGNKTLTFHLRSGVQFDDGQTLTSADVKASLERILAPKTAAVAASNLAAIASIQTPDASTVVLELHYPDAPIVAALADLNAAIVSHTAIANNTITKTADGTGPYEIAKWVPNQYVDLVRNPHYWGPSPAPARIDFRAVPDESSVVAAVRSGDADIGIVSNPVVARTAAGPTDSVVREPSIDYHVLMLNGRSGPLRDVRVRLALQCAISRQQVVETAALGEGQITGPITSPQFRSNPSDQPCPTPNLAKAKTLLAQAGYPSGFTLNTIVETGEYATAVAEAQSVQAQLKQIGVKLNLEVLNTNAYVTRWLDETFDAALALNTGRPDPDTQYGRYFESDGSLNKQGGIASPVLDRLFAEGRSVTSPPERQAIYAKLSTELTNLAPWVWLFVGYDYYIVGNKVHGFTAMPNGSLQFLTSTTVG